MKDQAADEIQQAFNSYSDKTKAAMAQVTVLYTWKHKDGKHYVQAQSELADGTHLPEFLPHGFSTEQNALLFQRNV